MLKSKVFLKKTKRGNITCSVREHYLRNDIYCGLSRCTICTPGSLNSAFIVDLQVATTQLDILEHPSVKNLVFISTILNQVKEKSLASYARIRNIVSQVNKNCYVFSNEFHHETFAEREIGEPVEERNLRALDITVQWYRKHANHCGSKVFLLTNESMVEFVESFKNEAPELIDMVATDTSWGDEQVQKFEYPEYLPVSVLQAGLKSGKFFQGKLTIGGYSLFEGSILTTVDIIEGRSIKIAGRLELNRAINDDVVVVELCPKSSAADLIDDEGEQMSISKDADDEVNAKETTSCQDELYGRVVGIIKRNWRAYAGSIDRESLSKKVNNVSQCVWFYPMDKRVPRIRIRTKQALKLIGQRIIVSIDSWEKNHLYPRGHFVRNIGCSGDKNTEVEVILLEHDVSFQPFSQQVLADLPVEGEFFQMDKPEIMKNRVDLRDLNICSIDPPGCTDIDDALHCRTLENGNFEVGVHIADVGFFVRPHTAMDKEASKRGTTVYLVDKRIDMLPSLLGTNLCSLRSNVDRLAFSCIWELTAEGDIISCNYTKSIIRSKASFTYGEAQLRIDDSNLNDDLTISIRNLNMIAKKLRKKREEAGSLTLASPEVRFHLEHESQDPVDLELKELKETNALVEDFMLLANISVARKIFEHFQESAVLRRHPKPNQPAFDSLKRALNAKGIKLHTETSKELSESLDKAILSGDEYFNKLLRILTTRCMMQAAYFCSGSLPEHEFVHYGLATPIYTHFTSPIRRYSDIMVHRLLAAAIDKNEIIEVSKLLNRAEIVEICDNLNYRHRMAQQAGRNSVELYTNLYFRGKCIQETGYVIRVLKNGFGVLVPKYGIEGFVFVEMTDPNIVFENEVLHNQSLGISISVFTKVKVEITIDDTSVAGIRQRLVMKLLDPKLT